MSKIHFFERENSSLIANSFNAKIFFIGYECITSNYRRNTATVIWKHFSFFLIALWPLLPRGQNRAEIEFCIIPLHHCIFTAINLLSSIGADTERNFFCFFHFLLERKSENAARAQLERKPDNGAGAQMEHKIENTAGAQLESIYGL